MHLARERIVLADGRKEQLLLPECACDDCEDLEKMIESGEPGSGIQFLQMHHEMLRVFRYLIEEDPDGPQICFLPKWVGGRWCYLDGPPYPLELWDLDDPEGLPREIVGLFRVSDPNFLASAFDGVRVRVTRDVDEAAIDDLGRFIERGIDLQKTPGRQPDGSGLHNTMHEYLAAHERKAAKGAEMNKIFNSRFNEYFWAMHLWIDGQYGRLLERGGQTFDTTGLDPETLEMMTHPAPHGSVSIP
jgi:hypothetical protein